MAGMSVSGLASGLDTSTIVSQLMQLERQPQNMLKSRLSDARVDAAAYRAVNTSLASLQSAAEALTKATAWTPTKASATPPTVSATAGPSAATGSVTFTVDDLAASHTVITAAAWTPSASATTLTISDADGDRPALTVELPANASLADAVKKINEAATAAGAPVNATAVNTGDGSRLQIGSTASGADGRFTVSGGPAFEMLAEGQDAKLTVGSGSYTFPVTSPSNTFTDVIAGTTFTVSKAGDVATVTVASDPGAITSAVQALVSAANATLATINQYGNNSPGSTAALRGDSTLRGLAGQVVEAVTFAIGDKLSAAAAGIQLSKDGKQLEFKADVFTATLKADPALAQQLVNGSGAAGTAVPGVAQRLVAVTKAATDLTKGSLVALANGKDREATDLTKRIDDWDLRLELREKNLMTQFTAMESALSKLQNQSSWLSSQLSALPSWSKSSEK